MTDAAKTGQGLAQRAMAGAVASAPGHGRAPYMDGLNPPQREAVEALEGPVLMLAGAGTGKTRALTARIAHLIATGTARPNEIIAVTFTNKAAREMKGRIGALLGEAVEGMPWLGTFHAIGVKFLRRHAELVGLKPGFTILDSDDQLRLIKQVLSAFNLDDKRWPPRAMAGLIDRWKNRAWRPESVPSGEAHAFDNRGTEIYAAYQERLKTLNACDFGDLLLHPVTILQANPDLLAQYHRWLRFILVDEYQDTNVAQYLFLRLLAQGHGNICCVGDDDQSIYGWRGAEVGNILRFERDFPGARVIRLEQNYRSTPHILAAAGGVIAANEGRLGKTLWTEMPEGEKVRLIGHWDGEEEARWIGDEIEALERGTRDMAPFSRDRIAILVRAGHQMRAFEDRFLSIGLPYRVIGGPRFYERQEIRDAMAYFRLAVSPIDDLAFERVVNLPRRGIGDKALQTVQRASREVGVSLMQGAALALRDGLMKGRAAGGLRGFIEDVARWHDAVRAGENHIELAGRMLDESGYTAMWQAERTPEAEGRLENLKELLKALEEFDNLQGFLEHVALIMDNEGDEAEEKVTLMTLHAAKGLEFPVVFLPGWEDGLFPSQRSMDENDQKGLEEERRLAYVGITRAELVCTISFAANRRVFGQWQSQLPSRFIDELPQEHVEVLTPPGLYGGGFGAAAPGGGMRRGGMRRQHVGDEVIDDGGASAQEEGLDTRAARADVYASPGWRRLQARSRQIAGAGGHGAVPAVASAEDSVFQPGERVWHQRFGLGTVHGVDGDKLAIAFDRAGERHIVARFVKSAEGIDDVPF
ncbi:MAG: UvrD-helicase domain-containing protein [Pararhodobacter sp.]|nr:UvrD-helicase domain-containing protein [Pararhodobacter sp.]